MIELKLKIDDVDYDGIINILYPYLKDIITKEKPELASVLFLNPALTEKAVKGAFSLAPQSTKDRWLCSAVNSHSAEIKQMITSGAENSGISFNIIEMNAEKK